MIWPGWVVIFSIFSGVALPSGTVPGSLSIAAAWEDNARKASTWNIIVLKKLPIVYGPGKIITNITTNSANNTSNQVVVAQTIPQTSFTHHISLNVGHGHLTHMQSQQYFSSSYDESSSYSSSYESLLLPPFKRLLWCLRYLKLLYFLCGRGLYSWRLLNSSLEVLL